MGTTRVQQYVGYTQRTKSLAKERMAGALDASQHWALG